MEPSMTQPASAEKVVVDGVLGLRPGDPCPWCRAVMPPEHRREVNHHLGDCAGAVLASRVL